MATRTTNSAIDAYMSDTISLVRSLVVKSEITAKKINQALVKQYGEGAVYQEYPDTWKYYMNLAGEYHSTDQIMKVISLDTHELIDFTVENMKLHIATAKAYQHGTRYYYSLARKFPSQVPLILAITNPVNKQVAINAPDLTILTWRRDLVETQEDNLILEIQNYIRNYLSRNTVIGFNNIYDYYPVLTYANLWMSLPSKIMNIRLKNCKTEKTHSFHMTQYLASHGRLDRFIPYLTLEQVMYLYHNIDRLNKHAGKTEIFKELIHWILVLRRVPLSEYSIRQLQEFGSDMLPTLRAKRTPLSTLENTAEAAYVNMDIFFQKEAGTEKGNPRYFEVALPRIEHSLETYNGSKILTKDLESAMVDYTNAVPDPLPDVMMRQWAYMATNDLYNVVVNFSHPGSGESFSLMAKDALIYYCYVYLNAHGVTVTKMPSFFNLKFRLNPLPSKDQLYQLVPNKFPELYDWIDKILIQQPRLYPCTSVRMFNELTNQIYERALSYWFDLGAINDPLKRGVAGNIVGKLYGAEVIELGEPGQTIQSWLVENNMPVYDYTREEANTILKQIYENATGTALDDTKSLKAIQKALLELFSQQSSYAIQFMREINDSDIIPLTGAAIRIGVDGEESNDLVHILAPVRILDVQQESHDAVYAPIPDIKVEADIDPMTAEAHLKAEVHIKLEGVQEYYVSLPVPAVRFEDPGMSPNPQKDRFYPMDFHDKLTPAQIAAIANNL